MVFWSGGGRVSWVFLVGRVGGLTAGCVVDGHAAVPGAVKVDVGALGHACVAAVAGAEEEGGRPVVGKVLGEGAGGAARFVADVVLRRVHGDVEHVAADDLMDVRGLRAAGEDEAAGTRCEWHVGASLRGD